MKNILLVTTLLLSTAAFAAAGGHSAHDDHYIPWDKIGWQAANLGILLTAIFFLIRKSIIDTFAKRRAEYIDRAEKTKSALKEAEATLAGIKERLSALETGEKKSLEAAQHEANLLKTNMIRDAETAAEKLKKDAQLIIGNELAKARAEINNAILTQAVGLTTKTLNEKAQGGTSAQEAAFVKQLEQVKA